MSIWQKTPFMGFSAVGSGKRGFPFPLIFFQLLIAFKELALFPRQLVITPAAERAALVIVVEVAFEAFVDMEYAGEVSFQERFARLEGPFSATADKDDGSASVIRCADGAAKKQLADFGYEMGIFRPVRFVYPGNMHSTLRVPHKQKLHGRTNVH